MNERGFAIVLVLLIAFGVSCAVLLATREHEQSRNGTEEVNR
jgi:hypothetical protein